MATLISRTRPAPLHDQIRRAIHARIQSGELRPGDQLPTEHEYAGQLGVSLAPVRQALLDLVAAGLIVRIKGRGTFVAESRVDTPVTLLASFTDALRSRRIAFSMTVLDHAIAPGPPYVVAALELGIGAPVVRLRRLALVRGEPAAILDAHLDAERFGRLASITGFESGRSLYRTLEEEFGTQVGKARSTLEVVRCDDDQAELLGVSLGTPALFVRSVTEDEEGRPIELADVLYRGDRFIFRIDSGR
ncbi:MAG: GntR family transcriptional regulator [Candidatus Limnocylindrales bacterium]